MGGWSYVAAIVAAGVLCGGIYQTGYNAAWRKSQIEAVTAERDAARADLATVKAAAELAERQASEISDLAETNQKRVKDLTDALAKANPADRCRLGDYARRLRDIR